MNELTSTGLFIPCICCAACQWQLTKVDGDDAFSRLLLHVLRDMLSVQCGKVCLAAFIANNFTIGAMYEWWRHQ